MGKTNRLARSIKGKMDINANIKLLNQIFQKNNSQLYIVGGYVRDYLLGIKAQDIDLAGNLSPESLHEILFHTDFKTEMVNKKIGAVKICIGNDSFIYTTFRKESYSIQGKHCPEQVDFTDNIYEDAFRRDFTCNALYYDIANNKIIDFFNGVKHIEQHRIVMVHEKTLYEDGLRILRMIRFAVGLDFEIDDQTYNQAKKNIKNLDNISDVKKQTELDLIKKACNTDIKKERANKLLEEFVGEVIW